MRRSCFCCSILALRFASRSFRPGQRATWQRVRRCFFLCPTSSSPLVNVMRTWMIEHTRRMRSMTAEMQITSSQVYINAQRRPFSHGIYNPPVWGAQLFENRRFCLFCSLGVRTTGKQQRRLVLVYNMQGGYLVCRHPSLRVQLPPRRGKETSKVCRCSHPVLEYSISHAGVKPATRQREMRW